MEATLLLLQLVLVWYRVYGSRLLHHIWKMNIMSVEAMRADVTEFSVDPMLHNVGPCHHGMTRPRVADGGGGLQIWRTAIKGWISRLGC
jgi:hypothetical protein